MCRSTPDICIVRTFTTHRRGVGHICSLSAFDSRRHETEKYGAPVNASKPARANRERWKNRSPVSRALRRVGTDASGRRCRRTRGVQRRGPDGEGYGGEPGERARRARRPDRRRRRASSPPGAASMFFDDAFARRTRRSRRDVALRRSVGRSYLGFVGHGRAPALSDARLRRPAEDDPAARGREVRCGESGCSAEIVRVASARGWGRVAATEMTDRERRLENSGLSAEPARDGGSVRSASSGAVPRGSAGGLTRMETECPLRCRRVVVDESRGVSGSGGSSRDARGDSRARG